MLSVVKVKNVVEVIVKIWLVERQLRWVFAFGRRVDVVGVGGDEAGVDQRVTGGGLSVY